MLRRITIYLSFLLLFYPVPIQTENATCPYDLPSSFRMIPSACYANTTAAAGSSATNCCWFVFAAYIYAAVRYSNITGAAFLPPPYAAACSSSFSSSLLCLGLVSPSLLSSPSCTLGGGGGDDNNHPSRFAANDSLPCQFATVSAVNSSVDVSPAVHLCTRPPDLLDAQPACTLCQHAVVASTFSLLGATHSKEFVTCGMAATIAIWSTTSPSVPQFTSYVLCVLQTLENVGDLSTSNLFPSPPPLTPPPFSRSTTTSRSVKIAVGSAAAILISVAAIVSLALASGGGEGKVDVEAEEYYNGGGGAVTGTNLPTEGLYIFTKSELKQATNGYSDKLLLGEGGSGRVYLGKLPSGQHVAIKRIYKKKKLGEFYREVEILAKLRHRNLTTLVGYCVDGREHVLVYEHMAGGNLARTLYHGDLTWRRRVQIAADVAEGLAYLHEISDGAVVHRDVKPTNVLLTEGASVAKLSDFGVSRVVPSDESHVSTEIRGTMGYVDPECFMVGHVSEAGDVYSFGIVMLELVTGMKAVVLTPSGGAESIVYVAHCVATEGEDWSSIVDPKLGPRWDRESVKEVFDLAYRCVKPYKNQRPRMREVVVALKRLLAVEDVASSGPSTEDVTDEFVTVSTSTSKS